MTSLADTVRMALATLRGNVLRSVLTLLGIVIGASTVVGMMSLTEGLRIKLNTDFSVLGAGAFVVSRWPAVNFGPGERTFLIAFDKKAGNDVWKVDEPGGRMGVWPPKRWKICPS